MDFRGKTIWITGASSGIGKAVAIELSSKNVTLILSSRKEEALKETEKRCVKNGCQTVILPFDLGNEQSIEEAALFIKENNIKIDALYQFGGISQRSFVAETPVSVDRKIFEVNYFGTIALTKRFYHRCLKMVADKLLLHQVLLVNLDFHTGRHILRRNRPSMVFSKVYEPRMQKTTLLCQLSFPDV